MFDFLKGFFVYLKNKKKRKLILLVSVFTSVSVFSFYIFQYLYTNALVEQTFQKQQLMAKAGANSIEGLIDVVGLQTYHLSHHKEIVGRTREVNEVLKEYMNSFGEYPVKGVVLADKEGIVLNAVNVSGEPVVEQSLVDRGYFSELKTNPKLRFTISQPVISRLGSTKGKYIVVVASPVLEEGEFNGLVASSILLSELTEKYLSTLKINEHSQIHLMNSEGIVLSSTESNLVGFSYLDFLQKNSKPDSLTVEYSEALEKVTRTKENSKVEINILNGTNQNVRFLVSMAALHYRNEIDWAMVVSSPVDTALIFDKPLEIFSGLSLIYVIFTIVLWAVYNIQENKVIKKESYIEGLKHGKQS